MELHLTMRTIVIMVVVSAGSMVYSGVVSTSFDCSKENQDCVYKQRVNCSVGFRISVLRARHVYKLSFKECSPHVFNCEKGCCSNLTLYDCTVDMAAGVVDYFNETCSGEQTCDIFVQRGSVNCGLTREQKMYSSQLEIEYECITDASTSTSTTASRSASKTTPLKPSTSRKTTADDVSYETSSLSSTETASKVPYDKGFPRGKGGNSVLDPDSGLTYVAGGVTAGAIILTVGCALLACRCKRRRTAQKKRFSESGLPLDNVAPREFVDNEHDDDADENEYDILGAKRNKHTAGHNAIYGHLDATGGDPDASFYDVTRNLRTNDVADNVYDVTIPCASSEHEICNRVGVLGARADVIVNMHDSAMPKVTSQDDVDSPEESSQVAILADKEQGGEMADT